MLKYGHFWKFLKFSPDSEADKMVLGSKCFYRSMQNDLSSHWKKKLCHLEHFGALWKSRLKKSFKKQSMSEKANSILDPTWHFCRMLFIIFCDF